MRISHATWLDSFALADAVGDLALYLWSASERSSARELLLNALFHSQGNRKQPQPGSASSPTVQWAYAKLVKRVIPVIAADDRSAALDLLLEILAQDKSAEDFRIYDTPEITIDQSSHKAFALLHAYLLDLLISVTADDPQSLRAHITRLEECGSAPLFRLSLHLLRLNGKVARDLVFERLTDPALLSNRSLDDDMMRLLSARLGDFESQQQERILEAVCEQCVSHSEFDDHEQTARLRGYEFLKWLDRACEFLPPRFALEHKRLRSTYGEPLTDDPVIALPRPAPTDIIAFETFTDDAVIAYLREKADDSRARNECVGARLDHPLRRSIRADPRRFSRLARRFRDVHPRYAASAVYGFGEVLGPLRHWYQRSPEGCGTLLAELPNSSEIDWGSLLELAAWVAGKTHSEVVDMSDGESSHVRTSAIELAEFIYRATAQTEPSHAKRAWDIIQRHLSDPDPPIQFESDDIDEYVNDAHRTMRGRALSAALHIGLASKRMGCDSDIRSTICATLETRARSKIEPSLAVRSILAAHFTGLCETDISCAAKVAESLFCPSEPDDREHLIFWRHFLAENKATEISYSILSSSYDYVLEALGDHEPSDIELGKHLLVLAIRGIVDFRADDNQLKRFIARASSHVRLQVLRALYFTPENMTDELRERLKMLWEWWLEQSKMSGDSDDLVGFGNLFSPAHFDAKWLLDQLISVLRLTKGALDWDREVIETLSFLAADYPQETAEVIALFVDAADPWPARYVAPTIQKILRTLSKTAASEDACHIASKLALEGMINLDEIGNCFRN